LIYGVLDVILNGVKDLAFKAAEAWLPDSSIPQNDVNDGRTRSKRFA